MTQAVALPMSSEDIKKIIPHRYPFLLVDRVTEFEDRQRIVGYKNVTANEEFFNGHFPERALMPGVLILEALAQLGVIFSRCCTGGVGPDSLMVFSGADSVKFRRPVVPGDCLKLELSDLKSKFGHWQLTGKATVEGELVASAIIKAAEIPK